MKILLLTIIRIYWILIPEKRRRTCLFKTTCSNHVFNITKNKGLISGLKALKFRTKNCNSNYSIIEVDGEIILISATEEMFKENEINTSII